MQEYATNRAKNARGYIDRKQYNNEDTDLNFDDEKDIPINSVIHRLTIPGYFERMDRIYETLESTVIKQTSMKATSL
mgnify:CR=1 FL=1